MAHKDDLSVSEKGKYKSDTQGPVSDTHAFHQDTPAPGERAHSAPPPASREPSSTTGSNLPKIPVQASAPISGHDVEDGLSIPVLIGGIGLLIFAAVAGALVVGLVWFGNDTPEPEAPPAIEEVDGIPVRKGLKKPRR